MSTKTIIEEIARHPYLKLGAERSRCSRFAAAICDLRDTLYLGRLIEFGPSAKIFSDLQQAQRFL